MLGPELYYICDSFLRANPVFKLHETQENNHLFNLKYLTSKGETVKIILHQPNRECLKVDTLSKEKSFYLISLEECITLISNQKPSLFLDFKMLTTGVFFSDYYGNYFIFLFYPTPSKERSTSLPLAVLSKW